MAAAARLTTRDEGKGRKASKDVRRQQLIEATIDSLHKRGFSQTTMADVADGAGLSRGIVNFHFESKEKLLLETLRFLSDEYAAHWRGAVNAAGPEPVAQLWALVKADFEPEICSRRKLAAWAAFWGEAKSRQTYRELCGRRDDDYETTLADICTRLHDGAGFGTDPARIAGGIEAMLWGLWLEMITTTKGIGRKAAHAIAIDHLVQLYPQQFTRSGPIGTGHANPSEEAG